jgi:hypothetical protein
MQAGASRRQAKRCAKVVLFALIGIALIAFASRAAPVADAARAGGSAPVIHWDPGMIYAGQNNGNPWGPVGEVAIVHGANFSPNAQLRLVVSPGDSNKDPSVCQQPVVTVSVGNVTTDATGGFTQNFSWPAAANHVNQGYSICSMLVSNSSVASSQDDGPFTVLSSSPPAIGISASTVAVGGTVTVTGQNWVPPQPISIIIATCAACGGATVAANASATSAGLNSGSFSVAIPIPSTAKPGSYVVDALTQTGLEAYYTTGVKNLAITAAPTTPTPTPTTQPSPTPSPTTLATAASSPTPIASATTSGSSGTVTTISNGSGGSTGAGTSGGNSRSGMVIILVVIAIILFLIAAVILFMLMQRRKRSGDTAIPQHAQIPPGPQFGQYGQPGQPGQYGQPGQFGQTGQAWPAGGQANQPGQFGQYGQFNQAGAPNGSGFSQAVPTSVSSRGYTPPAQQGPMGQMAQQGSYPPQFGGSGISPMPQGNFAPPNLPACPNCGRPLIPNLPACGVCGMPLALMRR